jgi:hypothetical protein
MGKRQGYRSLLVTDALQPEVDKVYAFLAPLDWLRTRPAPRSISWWAIRWIGMRTSTAHAGSDRWWNAADNASINSRSFNRYAEWLRLWNAKSSKRWLLWQIPSRQLQSSERVQQRRVAPGLQGQSARVFLRGELQTHLEKFASSGVFGLLFGAGAGGQSSYQNDTYTDGQLFLKSRAGNFLKAVALRFPEVPRRPAAATSRNGCD